MDILPSIIQNSDVLQDTLLVAGLHYAMATGDIQTYDSTILFHKVETIQLINKSLENPPLTGIMTLIRRIATLCLTESCFGNAATAEIHFDGLLTLLDVYLAECMLDTPIEFNEELTSRYLVLTYNVIHAVRSRMEENGLVSKTNGWPRLENLEEDMALLFSWYSQDFGDIGCLQFRLKAIAMLPLFFAAFPPTAKFYDIDGSPLIGCVRSLTELTGSIDLGDLRWSWLEGLASKLNFAIADSHAASLYGVTENAMPECSSAQTSFATSWCSIAITSGLYLHGVLGLWNAGKPIERRLFRLLMTMLARDLDRTSNESNGRMFSDLWFWRHFIGAYSLAWHESHAYDETLQAIESYFDSSIRKWSQACNVVQWEEAQQRLLKVAWPPSQPRVLAEIVWERALRKQQRASKPKVRTGCVTCKARHVKCDERKPTCIRCERAEIACGGFIKATTKKKAKTLRATPGLIPIRPRPERRECGDIGG
ncbi:hypothetical protein ACKAV7_010882 [Fusarium commune]